MAAGLRCGSTTIKYLLFFFNFLFTLCGLAIVIVGALGLDRTLTSGNVMNRSLVFIVVVGAFIFLVAFAGCCGAVRESHCLLVTFACLLMAIIVCEVVAAILIFVNIGVVQNTVDEVFRLAKEQGDSDATKVVDNLQSSLKCCGVNDASYWGSKIPASCYDSGTAGQGAPYNRGCKKLFNDVIQMYGKAIGVLAIGVAVIEIIGVWFALALAGEIKKLSR